MRILKKMRNFAVLWTNSFINRTMIKSQHPPNFMSALDVLIARGEQAAEERGMLIGEAIGKAEGKAEGEAIGKAEGIELTKKVFKLHLKGIAAMDIAAQLGIELSMVENLLSE
jgi:hypothetical protein